MPRTRRRILPVFLILGMAMTDLPAQSFRTPAPGSDERRDILDAARAPAENDLGKPVRFEVSALNVGDGWAFLMAQMRAPDGGRIDYAGTPYEDEAARGGRSPVYAALLRDASGQWHVLRHSTGPTDPAWLGWSDTGAPEGLFAIPGD